LIENQKHKVSLSFQSVYETLSGLGGVPKVLISSNPPPYSLMNSNTN